MYWFPGHTSQLAVGPCDWLIYKTPGPHRKLLQWDGDVNVSISIVCKAQLWVTFANYVLLNPEKVALTCCSDMIAFWGLLWQDCAYKVTLTRLLWQVALTGCSDRLLWQVALTGCSDRLLWQVALTGCSDRLLWQVALTGYSVSFFCRLF